MFQLLISLVLPTQSLGEDCTSINEHMILVL